MYPIKDILNEQWFIVTTAVKIVEYGYGGEIYGYETVHQDTICTDPADYLADIAGEICAGEVEYISSRPATFDEIMTLYDLSCRVGEILYWDYSNFDDPYRPEYYEELPF